MKCPACEFPLECIKVGQIELDQCRECRGVWFDHREIDGVLALPKIPSRLLEQALYREPPILIAEGERRCPRCHALLKTIKVDGINLDACSRCKGFFADRGEVKRLTQAAERRFQESPRE